MQGQVVWLSIYASDKAIQFWRNLGYEVRFITLSI